MMNPLFAVAAALGLNHSLPAIYAIPGRDRWARRKRFAPRTVITSNAVQRRRKHRAMTKAMRQILRRR